MLHFDVHWIFSDLSAIDNSHIMFTSTTKSPGAASSDTVTVSATVSSGVVSVMKQEKCLFGKSQVDIPEPLTENVSSLV